MGSMEALEGRSTPAQSTPLPWVNEQRAWLCVQSPHGLRVGRCAPRVGCRGRRQVAEVSMDGAVTKEPLASHHNYRPRGRKLGVSPLLQLSEPRLCEATWSSSTEGQAPRDSGASEQGSFTSPQCK